MLRAPRLPMLPGFRGNLLYIHGSGDDNVHFGNAEMLLNELIKYNKTFQFMEYPEPHPCYIRRARNTGTSA